MNEPPSKEEVEKKQALAESQVKKPKARDDDEDIGDGTIDQRSLDAISSLLMTKQQLAEFHQQKPSKEMDLFITEVNSKNLSWKANTCLLTEGHKDHDCSQAPQEQNLVQIPFGEGGDLFKSALAKVTSFSEKEIKDADIPSKWDLSDIDGYDFTGKVRDQGACGSCYSMAFI